MTAGRPRKPTAIKKAQGTFAPSRSNPKEPQPEVKLPRAPSWLDNVAKREWRRAGKILEDLGVISTLDLTAFAAYCTATSDLIRCEEILQQQGVMAQIIMTRTGDVRETKHPAFEMKHQALATIKKYMVEFGLSPASRSRVSAQPKRNTAADTARKYLIN